MALSHARLLPTAHRLPLSHHATFSKHAWAIVALISANVIWGGSAAASKAILPHIPPLTMASARVGIGLVVLLILTARRGEPIARGRSPMLMGMTGVALFCACQNLGLVFTDATTTALIGAVIPVLTIGLAAPMLGERLRGARLAGLLISMVGVGVIMSVGTGSVMGVSTITSLLPLASALGFALYIVIGRRAFGGSSALGLVAGSTRYGLLFLLPATVFECLQTPIRPLTVMDVTLLLYLGVGCSAVAFVLCGYGLSHIEAGHGAVYGNLKPLVGVALAVTALGEPLGVSQVVGGALVLVGIGLTFRRMSAVRGPFSGMIRVQESASIVRIFRRHAKRGIRATHRADKPRFS